MPSRKQASPYLNKIRIFIVRLKFKSAAFAENSADENCTRQPRGGCRVGNSKGYFAIFLQVLRSMVLKTINSRPGNWIFTISICLQRCRRILR